MMLARPPKDDRTDGSLGVPIEFVSREVLKEKNFDEKLHFILNKVKENMILVLEESLSPSEKKELITRSVENIDDDFPGIEFSSLENRPGMLEKVMNTFFKTVFGKENRGGLTIVGNSNVMEKVKESQDTISLLAKTRGI